MTCPPLIHDRCPCGNPLDLAVDHGDTPEGFPICETCCPTCNPKGPHMTDEKLHDIEYMKPQKVRMTRKQIEVCANLIDTIDPPKEQIDACCRWLADNPAPLTAEQLDRLPPGTIVETADGFDVVKTGTRKWRDQDGFDLHSVGIALRGAVRILARPEGVFVPLTEEEADAMQLDGEIWLARPDVPMQSKGSTDALSSALRKFSIACRDRVQ